MYVILLLSCTLANLLPTRVARASRILFTLPGASVSPIALHACAHVMLAMRPLLLAYPFLARIQIRSLNSFSLNSATQADTDFSDISQNGTPCGGTISR